MKMYASDVVHAELRSSVLEVYVNGNIEDFTDLKTIPFSGMY